MPYNFVAGSFHTGKLRSFLSLCEVRFYTENGRFAFLSPLGGASGQHTMIILAHWKARNGLPVSVNWTFFSRCYGWGATSEYRFSIGRFCSNGGLLTQNFRWQGSTPTNHSSFQKTNLNDLSYGIISTDHSSVLSEITRLTDRRTDRYHLEINK